MKDKLISKLLLFPLVFLVVIGLFVTSCAPTPTPTPTPTAKPEGTFTFGTKMTTCGFLPWAFTTDDSLVWLVVYDTPAYPRVDAEPTPSLATGWEFSTDYLSFTMWLREGIQFQGGWGEVTADDVKYTFEQLLGPATVFGPAVQMREVIESIEVIDPYTLVFHQNIPSGDILFLLTNENQYAPILCKKYLEAVGEDEANRNPVGSGPYRLVEQKTGDYLMYEAYDEHWRVVPEFKYLILRNVPEESTRVAMLKTGQIDATHISTPSIAEIPKEGFTVSYWPGGATLFLMFGGIALPEDDRYVEGYHMQDPWTDIRVREAMNIAIDREAINQALELGTATPLGVHWQIPGWKEQAPHPYDLERAKQLLAEAGYPDGFSLDIASMQGLPGCPMGPKEVEAVAGYWENLGLTVKLIPVELPVWWPDLKESKTAGTISSMRFTYKTNFAFEATLNTTRGPQIVYQDAELLRLCDKLLAEPDLTKRDSTWREIAKYEHDNYTTVPLLRIARVVVSNSQKVGEWPPNSSTYYYNFEYARHAEPLNTWRLFTP
ncbi:ABC transporter substrate-binding protein [Chloroflexota bacterium]